MCFVPKIISIIYPFVVKCYVKVYSARPTFLMLLSSLCLTTGTRPTQTYPTYRILEGQDFHPISAAAHFLTVDFLSRGALDNLS